MGAYNKMNCSLVVAALAVALVMGISGDSQASHRPRGASEYRSFPLWKDVPGRTFAKLGESILPSGSRWAAYVSRVGGGKSGRENPVLTVARITAHGQYNVSHAFGPLAPFRSDAPPVIAAWFQLPVEGEPGETILAMSLKPTVSSVKLTSTSGESIQRRTRLLNAKQQRKTHLPEMRYVALGLQQAFCLAEVDGYRADGEVEFEGQVDQCRPVNPPPVRPQGN